MIIFHFKKNNVLKNREPDFVNNLGTSGGNHESTIMPKKNENAHGVAFTKYSSMDC